MALGLFIIVLVGFLVFNYFKNLGKGSVSLTAEDDISLPTTHIVMEGEDLWSIAEIYYDSGYNWVDIAEANNIQNPNMLESGQEIDIPDVAPILVGNGSQDLAENTPTPTALPNETHLPTIYDNNSKNIATVKEIDTQYDQKIVGDTYTVVSGDNLWNIAVRAYGDGFRWKEIAQANNLINPSLIHRGNVFIIPR